MYVAHDRRLAFATRPGDVQRAHVPIVQWDESKVEARIVELRRLQPGWERVPPRGRAGWSGRRAVARRRTIGDGSGPGRWSRADGCRWRVRLVNGWKASIVSGVDDHSRFVISAHAVERATARPVCEALTTKAS